MDENGKGEGSDKKAKDRWWDKYHAALIDYASDLLWEDWQAIAGDDDEMADAMMDSTGKHKALALLDTYSIKDLNKMLKERRG